MIKTWIFCLLLVLGSSVSRADFATDYGLIQSPVVDAKESYAQGVKEFAGIQLEKEMLLPGLKKPQQKIAKEQYRIRPLNVRWKTFANVEKDKFRLRELIHYANRYNITMWRLIEKEKVAPKRRYKY